MRGLTDPIVANLYRRTSDGRTLFCPWGNLGRAYVVPPEREKELTTFVRRLYITMIVTIGILTPFLHFWTLALTPVFIGAWYYKYWSFSRTLEVDPAGPPPFDRQQAFVRSARASGAVRLWLFLILSLAFVATGVWMRSIGDRHATFVIVVFGLAAIVFAAQLIML